MPNSEKGGDQTNDAMDDKEDEEDDEDEDEDCDSVGSDPSLNHSDVFGEHVHVSRDLDDEIDVGRETEMKA